MGSCKHPLKGFQIGWTDKGKPNYKITSFEANHVELSINGSVVVHNDGRVYNPSSEVIRDYVTIPCGRCIGCRLQYSRDWANRCMLELKNHKESWFITLTYDDNHLPMTTYTDDETGEILPIYTLYKKDFQNFMKSLRKKFGEGIRYFACGEYGDKTVRPHYHAIIYGLHLEDLHLYKRSELGDILYNSPVIDKIWKKGYCVLGEVTWNSCAYVARYVTKKKYGKEKEFYERFNLVPEFVLMSRRPGIARDYYDTYKDKIFDSDFIYLGTDTGSITVAPPRYFKRLYEVDNPVDSEIMKNQNKEFSEMYEAMRCESTSKSYLDMLQTEENVLLSRVTSLNRSEI